jgi:hypothetical protein
LAATFRRTPGRPWSGRREDRRPVRKLIPPGRSLAAANQVTAPRPGLSSRASSTAARQTVCLPSSSHKIRRYRQTGVLSSYTLYLPKTCFTSSNSDQPPSDRLHTYISAPPLQRGRSHPVSDALPQGQLGKVLLYPIEFLFANLSSGVALSGCCKSAILFMRMPG